MWGGGAYFHSPANSKSLSSRLCVRTSVCWLATGRLWGVFILQCYWCKTWIWSHIVPVKEPNERLKSITVNECELNPIWCITKHSVVRGHLTHSCKVNLVYRSTLPLPRSRYTGFRKKSNAPRKVVVSKVDLYNILKKIRLLQQCMQ